MNRPRASARVRGMTSARAIARSCVRDERRAPGPPRSRARRPYGEDGPPRHGDHARQREPPRGPAEQRPTSAEREREQCPRDERCANDHHRSPFAPTSARLVPRSVPAQGGVRLGKCPVSRRGGGTCHLWLQGRVPGQRRPVPRRPGSAADRTGALPGGPPEAHSLLELGGALGRERRESRLAASSIRRWIRLRASVASR